MTAERAPGVTNQHYDLPPKVFQLFLDRRLKYSAGIYEGENDSLEEAQERKLELIAKELQIKGGERVLDVGCGWGSVSLFLAERYGCDVVGITPSPHQAEFVRRRAVEWGVAERVRVECAYFENVDLPAASFDAITFVGSIVHMVDKGRVLKRSHELAKRRARLYLSETCFRSRKRYEDFKSNEKWGFIHDDIFGWGDCVPVSDYVGKLEDAGFSLSALHDLTADYKRTIEEWKRRAESNRAELDAFEAGMTDKLVRYFDISNAAWGFTTKQYAVVATKLR